MVSVSRRRAVSCSSYWLLVGNKEYLLLTDSNGALLAPLSVIFSSRAGALYICLWYGSFPAQLKDVKGTI